MPLYNTGAPKIFKGMVMIGSGGTESGPNRGYVVAHDAETGEFLWKFYIVPGNPADGFENEAMPRPGPASGGSTAVAATHGTDSPTTPISTSSTSAPVTARHGIRK